MPFVKQTDIKILPKGFSFPGFSPKTVDFSISQPPPAATKNFVGRTREVETFVKEILVPETPRYNILSVSEEKGIGKTELLRKFFEMTRSPDMMDYCLSAYVNEAQTTLDDIMEQFAAQLRMDGDFRKALETYRRLEAGRQSPQEATKENIVRAGSATVSAFLQPVPALGQATTIVAPAIRDSVVSTMQEKQQLKDVEQKKNSVRNLTRAFVDSLNRLTTIQSKQKKRNQRILLFIDTFEKQSSMIAPWLLDYFLLLQISNNVVLIVAAPLPLDQYAIDSSNNWASYIEDGTLHSMPLAVFTEGETNEYLAKRGNLDKNDGATIFRVSHGLPIILQSIANHPKVDPSVTTDTMVEAIYLQGIPDRDPKKPLSLSGAHFSKPFNRDDIDAFSTLSENFAFLPKETVSCDELFSWLITQEFVQASTQGRYSYDDYVQELFSQRLFHYSKERYFAVREALASYYNQQLKRIQDLQGPNAYESAEWSEVVRALLEQLFLLRDQTSTLQTIEYTLLAHAHISPQAMQDLRVGMLHKIAQELPDQPVLASSRLAARYLSQYIVSGLGSNEFVEAASFLLFKIKDDSSCPAEVLAHLYRDLGISYALRFEYKQAIENLNKAAAIDSNDMLIYVNRGLAYLTIGAYPQAIQDLDYAIKRGFQNIEVYVSYGLAYLSLGHTEQALKIFNSVLASAPKNALALTYRGILYIYLSEFAQALQDFNEAMKQEPDQPLARTYRGFTYLSLHESQQAIEDLDIALAGTPNSFFIYRCRGLAYAFLNKQDTALADLNHAIDMSPDAVKAQAYAARGFAYSFLNMPQEAIEDCKHALKLSPHLLEAYNSRGFAYNMLNQPQKAINDFEYVLKRAPMFTWAYLGRGQAYLALNQLKDAIVDFDITIKQVPKLARAYSSRGLAYAIINNFDQALIDCNYALTLDNQDAQAYASRGLLNAMMNKPQDAIADCQYALNLTPNVIAYIGLGQAYIQIEKLDNALQNLNQAVELAPNLALPYAFRGLVYAIKEMPKDAIEDSNHALKLAPDNTFAYLGLGLACTISHPQQAIEYMDHAADLAPTMPAVYIFRGQMYLDQMNYQHAIEDFNRGVELAPFLKEQYATDIASAYAGLGEKHVENGEYPLAVQNFTHSIELNPDDDQVFADRASAYVAIEDYPHAIEDFSKAIDLNSDTTWLYRERGEAYLNVKDAQHAIEDFSHILDAQTNDAEVYSLRGQAYQMNGEYEKAIQDFNHVLELAPDSIGIYADRGFVYLQQSEYPKAIEDVNRVLDQYPDEVFSLSIRAIASLYLNSLEQASADYAYLQKRQPTDINFCWMAEWVSMCQKAPDEGTAERLAAIAAIDPKHYVAHICRGVAHYLRNYSEAASTELQQAILLDPGTEDGYFWTGLVDISLRKEQDAKTAIEKALELKLPPALLAPLHWLIQNETAFYKDYVVSLFARYQV